MKLVAVAAVVLAAASAAMAQLPLCPIQLSRKVSKAAQPGQSATTKLTVANPGSRPVVVNVQMGLPDNVCATKTSTCIIPFPLRHR
jgi:hypothetical protein